MPAGAHASPACIWCRLCRTPLHQHTGRPCQPDPASEPVPRMPMPSPHPMDHIECHHQPQALTDHLCKHLDAPRLMGAGSFSRGYGVNTCRQICPQVHCIKELQRLLQSRSGRIFLPSCKRVSELRSSWLRGHLKEQSIYQPRRQRFPLVTAAQSPPSWKRGERPRNGQRMSPWVTRTLKPG